MRILLGQINPVVGDVAGNVRLIRSVLSKAPVDVDVVAFPEMCVTGYPPRDLVERPAFVREAIGAVGELARDTVPDGPGVLVGSLAPSGHDAGTGVANAAFLLADGRVVHEQHKSLLPTYDVFDEARYFDAAESVRPVDFRGVRLGITVCEDMWNLPDQRLRRRYPFDPVSRLVENGANFIVNISASPFSSGKESTRIDLLAGHAQRHSIPVVMVNQVGGNDDLVFDGSSAGVGPDGVPRVVMPSFTEATGVFDDTGAAVERPEIDPVANVYHALVLGTRDYVSKCGFNTAVLGLSGGIDSAVTLALAVDALGADNVTAVAMPSPHSSQESIDDARTLAAGLAVRLHVIPIERLMTSYGEALGEMFRGLDCDVTEENIQARIRGNLLMALSNKFGSLLLTTGNKSELAVGYCTLYGDMSGGLAVISDVPKTLVYELARFINRNGDVIPRCILDKPPSAELRPGQKDADSLPDYETLDAILDLYVESAAGRDEILAAGYDADVVDWVLRAVRLSEYKRRQAAPGLKVTSKAFGGGRRYPIASRFEV